MFLNQAYRKKHKTLVNWIDYNETQNNDEHYLGYFDYPNQKLNKSISVNPKIIKRKQKQPLLAPPVLTVKPNLSLKQNLNFKSVNVKGVKATTDTLPPEILEKAKFVNASRIFYEQGQTKAQDYLDNNGLNYTINELSSDISLVLLNNETGKPIITYRGTDITNTNDLITDALALFGQEKSSPEYGESKGQLEAVEELYGKPTELLGFSRGSVLSMNLGDEYNITTTQFNPLISPSLVRGQDNGTTHTIYRTLNDPVSILAKGKTKNSKWNIKSILPLKDTLNPIEEHYLKQFLSNDTPRRTSVEEYLNNRIVELGAKASEYTMMKEMLNFVEKQANFTSYMESVNPADAVIGESQRVYTGSNYTELWKDLGGNFSPEESHAISQNQVGTIRPFETTPTERKAYALFDNDSRQTIIDTALENLNNTLETTARYSAEPNSIRETLVKQYTLGGTNPETSSLIINSLHPVSQIKGLISGVAGFEEAELLNNLSGNFLGSAGTVTLGGALGAVNTSIASAALAGSAETLTAAALLPEIIAGAGGGLAGYETSQAIAQALISAGANQDTVQAVSAISGGAVGGASTAVIGLGAAALGSALTGGEIGAVLAPETAGVSIALGLGLGAVIGAGGYAVNKIGDAASTLIGEIQHPTINPYYIPPDFNTSDPRTVMNYLNRKDAAYSQQQQDESQGITPEQRVNLNNGN